MVGVELVRDRETHEAPPRAMKLTEAVVRIARERGLLLYSGTGNANGVDGDVDPARAAVRDHGRRAGADRGRPRRGAGPRARRTRGCRRRLTRAGPVRARRRTARSASARPRRRRRRGTRAGPHTTPAGCQVVARVPDLRRVLVQHEELRPEHRLEAGRPGHLVALAGRADGPHVGLRVRVAGQADRTAADSQAHAVARPGVASGSGRYSEQPAMTAGRRRERGQRGARRASARRAAGTPASGAGAAGADQEQPAEHDQHDRPEQVVEARDGEGSRRRSRRGSPPGPPASPTRPPDAARTAR